MSEFIGVARFGLKTAAGDVAQQQIALGDEFDLVHSDEPTGDTTMIANKSSRRTRVRWVKNNQATALVPGQAVMRDPAGDGEHDVKDVTGASVAVMGWVDPYLASNVAEDEKFFIVISGPTLVRGADTTAAGLAIMNDAAGLAAAATLSTLAEAISACGVMLEANTVYSSSGTMEWCDVNCDGIT